MALLRVSTRAVFVQSERIQNAPLILIHRQESADGWRILSLLQGLNQPGVAHPCAFYKGWPYHGGLTTGR